MKDIEKLLNGIDIKINGNRPWDIKINNSQVWKKVLSNPSLGLGESYMDGDWECDRLDIFFEKVFESNLNKKFSRLAKIKLFLYFVKENIFNLQSVKRAFEVGEKHYDLGNDLYENMLDRYMQYSCAYWGNGAKNLNEAQEHKLEMICKKLDLKYGEEVLEIGCGWGELARYMEKNYQVNVTGLTVSKEQKKYFEEKYPNSKVKILLKDYRDLLKEDSKKFDKIVSVGMFEHVGIKNYEDYFNTISHCMKKDGIALVHTIGRNIENVSDPWISKYIFPNGQIPDIKNIIKFINNNDLIMEDWHNFGKDYDLTLMAWLNNFNNSWSTLNEKYDDRFYKMWTFYLSSCAALFRSRQNLSLWQIIFTNKKRTDQYRSFRY